MIAAKEGVVVCGAFNPSCTASKLEQTTARGRYEVSPAAAWNHAVASALQQAHRLSSCASERQVKRHMYACMAHFHARRHTCMGYGCRAMTANPLSSSRCDLSSVSTSYLESASTMLPCHMSAEQYVSHATHVHTVQYNITGGDLRNGLRAAATVPMQNKAAKHMPRALIAHA